MTGQFKKITCLLEGGYSFALKESGKGDNFWHFQGVLTEKHEDSRQGWLNPFTEEVILVGLGRDYPPGPAQ